MLDDILIKLITAGILLLVMLASVLLGRKGRAGSKVVLVTYTLALFAVVVLGYYGAELVFGGKTEVVAPEYQAGAKIFRVNCNACHPSGGNIVNPKLSVLGAPQLIDFKSFLAYLRAPKPPPGFPPLMPPVPPTKLSDQQVQQLFEYITKSLEHPRRKAQAP